MKRILLALLLLAAALPAAQLGKYLFNGNGTNSSGAASNMTINGTIPYVSSPDCEGLGNQSAGPLTVTNYYSNTDLGGRMVTAGASWRVTGYAYFSTHNTYPTVFTTDAGLLASYPNVVFLAGYSASNLWRLYANGNDNFSAHTISDSTCYFFDIRGTSSNLTLIINGTTEVSVSVDATWKGSDLRVGYPAFGGAGMTGYVQDFQFFDSASTPTPTITMTNSPGNTNTFTYSPTITPTFTSTPTATGTPTRTPTFTNSATPVPMDRFAPYTQNPILRPTMTWEAGNTARLSVVNDHGLLRAAYWGGAYSSPGGYINTATSTDGLTWTRTGVGPIIGNGAGGESSTMAERPTLLMVGPGSDTYPAFTNGGLSEFWIYYQRGPNPSDIMLETSPDFVTWTNQGVVIANNIAGSSAPFGWNSVGVYYDGSKWLVTAQGGCAGACDSLFQSTDGKTSFSYVSDLTDLNQGYSPHYSGRSFIWPRSGTLDGQIQNFFTMRADATTLSGVTDIFHALATNNTLQHFIVAPTPCENLGAVSTTSNIQMTAPDGLIDGCLTSLTNLAGSTPNKVFLYYTLYDNTNEVHRLGVSVFGGTMDDLYLNNTLTPTQSPTFSVSPTITQTLTNSPTPSATQTVTPLPTATPCSSPPCGNWWDMFRRRRRSDIPGPVTPYAFIWDIGLELNI